MAEHWSAVAVADHEFTNYQIRDRMGSVVATVYARSDGETAKPAHLIAAAPAMLEALEWALPLLVTSPPPWETEEAAQRFAKQLLAAQAAIQQAVGPPQGD
jgi:hypothetical protein